MQWLEEENADLKALNFIDFHKNESKFCKFTR